VVVQEEDEIAASSLLAVDSGWSPLDTELLDLESARGDELLDELGGCLERSSLGRDARLPAQKLEQSRCLFLNRHVVGVGHVSEASLGRAAGAYRDPRRGP